jgi:hypothetical protein
MKGEEKVDYLTTKANDPTAHFAPGRGSDPSAIERSSQASMFAYSARWVLVLVAVIVVVDRGVFAVIVADVPPSPSTDTSPSSLPAAEESAGRRGIVRVLWVGPH